MALSRVYKDTVLAGVRADPNFCDTILKEGIETLLTGNLDIGKAVLSGYIKVAVGFEQFGAKTGSSPKSLIRMFGPPGNPQARNRINVIIYLRRVARLTLQVTAKQQ